MASHTQVTGIKRHQKKSKQGRKRKNLLSKKSTSSAKELFACIDEPAKK